MATNGTRTTLGEALAVEPGNIADNVKGEIIGHLGEQAAANIGALNMFELTSQLTAILPDPEFNAQTRLETAEKLLKFLERIGFGPKAEPQTIKMVQDKTLDQMTLTELLELLVDEPGRRGEILTVVGANPQVRTASSKTHGKWIVPNPDGRGIDVGKTVRYVEDMNKPHSVAQRMVSGGIRPATIDYALGIDTRALINPFTGRPMQGPDGYGFDFNLLDPALHEALIWAAVTGHSAWPGHMDVYTFTEQVFQKPLPRRWQIILDDYVAAKETDPDSVRLITRYWPKDLSLEAVMDLAAGIMGSKDEGAVRSRSQRTAADYEQLVRGNAQAACQHSGMNATVTGGIYNTIDVRGMNGEVSDVVVLDGGRVVGMNMNGVIFTPPGVSIQVGGMNASVAIVPLTWEELAKKARLV